MTTLDVVPTIGQPIIEVDKAGKDDLRLWSVTTILDVANKGEGLMIWACRMAAAAALDDADYVDALLEGEGRDAAIKWIANARRRPKYERLTDAQLGSAFHMLAEKYTLTGTRPDCAEAESIVSSLNADLVGDGVRAEADLLCVFLDQFDSWLNRLQPEFEAAEYVVYSPMYGYAGTCDGGCVLPAGPDNDRMRVNYDIKTTREAWTGGQRPKRKTPYSETVLQLAAYRHAEFAAGWGPRRYSASRRYYLLNPGERALAIPMDTLNIEGSVCILVTPEFCDAYPMRTDQAAFDAFLYCLEMARWQFQASKGAVGEPLRQPTPPKEED